MRTSRPMTRVRRPRPAGGPVADSVAVVLPADQGQAAQAAWRRSAGALHDFRLTSRQQMEAHRRVVVDMLIEALAIAVLAGTLLYVLIGHAPFQHTPSGYTDDVSPINRWIWLALLGLSAPILWVRRRDVVTLAMAMWPLLVLYVWFGLSTRWALDNAASTRRFILYIVALVIFTAVAVGIRNIRSTHRVLLYGTALVVLIDLGSWLVLPRLAMTGLGLAGIHSHKNGAGVVALFALLVAMTYVPMARTIFSRAGVVILALLCLVLLILTRSSTSISIGLGVLALLPVVVVVLRRSGPTMTVIAGAAAIMLLAGVFCYIAWAGLSAHDAWRPFAGITFTDRTDVWAFTLSEIWKRPYLGVGFNSFWDIETALQPSLYKGLWFASGTEFTNESHNGFLDLCVTTGLVGLVAGVLVMVRQIAFAGHSTMRAPHRDKFGRNMAERPGDIGLATAAFHLGFMLLLPIHNLMESSYFVANIPYGTLFLFSATQLECWRMRRAQTQSRPAARSWVPALRRLIAN
ncbi:MAG TPA: O-antigen ligase family protein [Stellaceae bacterium]|nr:O-antigen ligase family protein [Stellaceae bacterium]